MQNAEFAVTEYRIYRIQNAFIVQDGDGARAPIDTPAQFGPG